MKFKQYKFLRIFQAFYILALKYFGVRLVKEKFRLSDAIYWSKNRLYDYWAVKYTNIMHPVAKFQLKVLKVSGFICNNVSALGCIISSKAFKGMF